MSVKERLSEIRKIDSCVNVKSLEVEKLESMAIYKGVTLDPNKGSCGPGGRPNSGEDLVIRMIDMKNDLNRQIGLLIERKMEGMKIIDSLSDGKMIEIFYMRYFEYRKWEEIADELGITFQWVYELHKRGLNELSKKFPNL